jgi:hypothetical protein
MLTKISDCFWNYIEEVLAEVQKNYTEKAKKTEQVEMLEGVCFLHGISDLYSNYMLLSKQQIIDLVSEAIQNNWRQTPFKIHYINTDKKEIKKTDKPMLNWDGLELMSKWKEIYFDSKK